jgi:signal transduction histidine kinase
MFSKLRQQARHLRWQVMVSYLPIIAVPVLVVSLVTRNAAEQGLNLITDSAAETQANRLAQCFTAYYQSQGSFLDLADLLEPQAEDQFILIPSKAGDLPTRYPLRRTVPMFGMFNEHPVDCVPLPVFSQGAPVRPGTKNPPIPLTSTPDNPTFALTVRHRNATPPPPGQIFITDASGTIIQSDESDEIGKLLSTETLKRGAQMTSGGTLIGYVIVNSTVIVLSQQQQTLLDGVNTALVVSGLVSILTAIVMGLWLSWRISRPLGRLKTGVDRLATGAWSTPLDVPPQQEFADLTRAFNQMAAEVTRQQQLRQQMVADVAHDLRTPLSAMLLDIEAIEAGFQTPTEAAHSLREDITWLQRLVDDLRTITLLDADQLQLDRKPTPLCPFLNGVADFWMTLAEDAGRDLSVEMSNDLPVIAIDPVRIRQVLSNLLDNAIRHTANEGHILVQARCDANGVTIAVQDDGEGISPSDMPHIFERFYRADRARGRKNHGQNSGSGLGLSIARRLVELHHGTIAVQSTLGRGTTFTIWLPA